MALEWIIFLVALACGVLPILRNWRLAPRPIFCLVVLCAIGAFSAHALSKRDFTRQKTAAARAKTMPQIERENYARSDACISCHPRSPKMKKIFPPPFCSRSKATRGNAP